MTPGFPANIYTPGRTALKYFEIELDTGEIVKAYVDPTRQYAAEGSQWHRADTEEYIPTHRVKGFREIQ